MSEEGIRKRMQYVFEVEQELQITEREKGN